MGFQAWHDAGAKVAIGYQSDRFRSRVEDLTADWKDNPPVLVECDVAEQKAITNAMEEIGDSFDGKLDGLCHSIATSTGEAMKSDFVDCSKRDFLYTLDISCYSLISLTREALPMLKQADSASVLALTFLGGQRAIKNYKVMGPAKACLEATCRSLAAELVSETRSPYYRVLHRRPMNMPFFQGDSNIRVNSISPGPIQTPAARGIPGFIDLYNSSKDKQFVKEDISIDDVGDMATFLASDKSRKISGQTMYGKQ